VFMDVAGTFNNVHHTRLIDNMRKRRIPVHITKWVESFLKGRSTQLRFNGITSETIPTPAGTPQGSPLSPILYIYYNGDLLDITRRYPYCHSLGFIDDIAYGIQGQSDDRNAAMI
jgi:retron-type reverse transcriptase